MPEVRHCWVTPVRNWLKPIAMAGADEEAGRSTQEVSGKYRMLPVIGSVCIGLKNV